MRLQLVTRLTVQRNPRRQAQRACAAASVGGHTNGADSTGRPAVVTQQQASQGEVLVGRFGEYFNWVGAVIFGRERQRS